MTRTSASLHLSLSLATLLLAGCGNSGSLFDGKADVQPLQAGVAMGLIRVPVGTPLGGYLRPPVGGDYLPGLEDLGGGDPTRFFADFLDFLPTAQDHDGVPLAPLPDELRKLHSPYATISPPSRGYYDSLNAKAVALFDGNDYVVFVKTDLIAMLDELVQAVADDVQARTGVDLHDGLVMSGSHTHDGPGAVANHSVRFFWAAADVYQPYLFEQLVTQFADVVVASLQNLQPARFGYAMGEEGYTHPIDGPKNLNSFRRARLDSYDLAANDALRRRIGVLRIDRADGQPLAAIINYAVHGIAFDVENQFFSGDVSSSIEREVEQSFDTPVLALLVQNTGGDVSPRADGGPTLQRIERLGKLMAPQVRAIYDGVSNFDAAPDLKAVSQRVVLSREALGYAADEYPYPFGGVQCNNALGVPFTGPELGMNAPVCVPATPPDPADLADNGVAENGSFVPQDTRLMAVQVGRALILPQPGEPLTEYGVRLLNLAQDQGYAPTDTFIWGYAQDHVGYILAPEKADWDMGGTEGTTTFWGWKQGQRFLDGNIALMQSLRDGSTPPADEFELDYSTYRMIYQAVPAPPTLPSLRAGRVVIEPQSIQRFQAATFAFEGGDPVVDLPSMQMEVRNADGSWSPMRRRNGEAIASYYETQIEYRLITAAHVWTLRFEAAKDWPVGEYRFVVSGTAPAAYSVSSAPFVVTASSSLMLSALVQNGDQTEVTLAYTPRPNNVRLIDLFTPTDQPSPVREGAVTFSNGTQAVTDDAPDIENRDGALVAVYRAALAGAVTVTAADRFGNTAP